MVVLFFFFFFYAWILGTGHCKFIISIALIFQKPKESINCCLWVRLGLGHFLFLGLSFYFKYRWPMRFFARGCHQFWSSLGWAFLFLKAAFCCVWFYKDKIAFLSSYSVFNKHVLTVFLIVLFYLFFLFYKINFKKFRDNFKKIYGSLTCFFQ